MESIKRYVEDHVNPFDCCLWRKTGTRWMLLKASILLKVWLWAIGAPRWWSGKVTIGDSDKEWVVGMEPTRREVNGKH